MYTNLYIFRNMKLLFSLIFFCSSLSILPIYCGNLFNLRALKYPETIRMALQKIDFLRYEFEAQAQIQKEFLKTAQRVEELFGDEFVNEGNFLLKDFLKKAIEVIVREIHELPDYEIYISSLPKQMAKFVPENIVDEVPLLNLKKFAINKVDSYYRLQEYFNNIVTLSNFFDPITYNRITTELNAIIEYEKQQISIEGKAKTAPMTVQNAFKHLFKLFLRRIKFAIEEGNLELVKEIKMELEDTTMVRFHFEIFILKIETLKMIFDAARGAVQRTGDLNGQIEFLKPYHQFAKKQKEKAAKFKNWTDISKSILPTFKAQLKLEDENLDEKHKITKHEHGKEKGNEGNSAVTENLPNLIMGILCHEAIKKMNLPNNFENWENLADMNNEKWKEAFKKFTGEDYEPELKKGQLMEAQMLSNVAAVKLLDKYIEDHRLYVGEFQKMAKKAAQAELGKKEESVGEQSNI